MHCLSLAIHTFAGMTGKKRHHRTGRSRPVGAGHQPRAQEEAEIPWHTDVNGVPLPGCTAGSKQQLREMLNGVCQKLRQTHGRLAAQDATIESLQVSTSLMRSCPLLFWVLQLAQARQESFSCYACYRNQSIDTDAVADCLSAVGMQDTVKLWQSQCREFQARASNLSRSEEGRQRTEHVSVGVRTSEQPRGSKPYRKAVNRQARELASVVLANGKVDFIADALRELFRLLPELEEAYASTSSAAGLQSVADAIVETVEKHFAGVSLPFRMAGELSEEKYQALRHLLGYEYHPATNRYLVQS